MPPPPSFRRESISIIKPGLPAKGWSLSKCYSSPPSEQDDGHDLLKTYKGPQAFCLPGNHDWFDGLGTFTRFILSRDWLGGWLMPQERSYFAIMLPQGWWIFGVDLALSEDIDTEQYKYFADLAQRRVGPNDAVIIMTHEPYWVLDTSENRSEDGSTELEFAERNLRELMGTYLKGKVRCRIAGDLHHYTRHVPMKQAMAKGSSPSGGGGAVGSPATRPTSKGGQQATPCPAPVHPIYMGGVDGGGLAAAAKKIAQQARNASLRILDPLAFDADANGGDDELDSENLPELIVSGGGGAFLHPTHTFAKHISVNFGKRKNRPYVRTKAYPSKELSFGLSWLNVWQFRWRNWRLDVLFVVIYIGIVASLLPLCGVYSSYAAEAMHQGALAHLKWCVFFSCVVSF